MTRHLAECRNRFCLNVLSYFRMKVIEPSTDISTHFMVVMVFIGKSIANGYWMTDCILERTIRTMYGVSGRSTFHSLISFYEAHDSRSLISRVFDKYHCSFASVSATGNHFRGQESMGHLVTGPPTQDPC